MATYLVGDIQGCYLDLRHLLDTVHFSSSHDHLYIVGDLIGRGPDSLAVLRYVRDLGEHAHTVLGNHDLHLLAVAEGIIKAKDKDKILPILEAPDCDELLYWLRHQPLLIHRNIGNNTAPGFVITHAGIPPVWDLHHAKKCASEVEDILISNRYVWLLRNMYSDHPTHWLDSLQSIERYRYIINALTRMRYLDMSGGLDMVCKLAPEKITNQHLFPWFYVKRNKPMLETLVFGHWATLGGIQDDNLLGLDTGCVWGGSMTIVRWEDGKSFSLPCEIHAN
ncbi:symmetrical bis(5'-nucleosyl)-tetraphosphatase [Candidatus Enterovibrio escicola]|uniref:symmetrical bis(5'-nucleosyl)-tetraphosphatase n=1 Tax=Candidatus Enterovibrio escicola TaxID=1927127 RepID=UPI00123805FE|nr:symmetrical bis(5'-nucleosyl)-tetraphosphatase [Candidatus Enterovibrio escacola]